MAPKRYIHNVPNWWYLQTWILCEILRHVVPESESRGGHVGILGSVALLLHQEHHRIGPKWPGLVVDKSGRAWTSPGDYDVFVAGHHGKSKESFMKFVHMMLERIARLGHGVAPCAGGAAYQIYVRGGEKIWIMNFYISGITKIVSFVQSPRCDNLAEVVEGFDIDVCKVIYNLYTQKTSCSADVEEQIRRGTSKAMGLLFEDGVPSPTDGRIVARTVHRIRKYIFRGFAFPGCVGVYFNGGKPETRI